MNEYKNSHIKLKFAMLSLQKYLLLILKICNISAEDLAKKIGVTDHLIRNFMSEPVRAIMPRTTFISIMSILEIEKKRNDFGFLLTVILNNIFTVPIYFESKKIYDPDLITLRSKSKKVLSKATDTKELNSMQFVNNLFQNFSTLDSALVFITPKVDEIKSKVESYDDTCTDEDVIVVQNSLKELLQYISDNKERLETVIQDEFENKGIDDFENAYKLFSEATIQLVIEAAKIILPKYCPEYSNYTDDDIREYFKAGIDFINPFRDDVTEDGIPGWLELIYSVDKIDDKLNQEIDNLVLNEKKLDVALETLFKYYRY